MSNDQQKKPNIMHLLNALCDAHLGCPLKLSLLTALARIVNSEPDRGNAFVCYAYQERLIAITGMSRSSLKRTALALEKDGIIRRRTEYKQPTYYWLMYDRLAEIARKNREEAEAKRAEARKMRELTPDEREDQDELGDVSDDDLASEIVSDIDFRLPELGDVVSPEPSQPTVKEEQEDVVAKELTLRLLRGVGHWVVSDADQLQRATKTMRGVLESGKSADQVSSVIDCLLTNTNDYWRERIKGSTHPCNMFAVKWGDISLLQKSPKTNTASVTRTGGSATLTQFMTKQRSGTN